MDDIRSSCQRNICSTYARLPVLFVRGQGCRLWDENGTEYLDFLAGIAVCNLGHSHPEIAQVLCDQAKQLIHVSNLFFTEPQVKLAAELTRLSFADKVFFGNSGAEANEAAIKLARKYSQDRHGPGRFHVISMRGSFHGRTLATLSATGQEKVHKGFEPLVEGFTFVDFNSVDAVQAALTEHTCAVLVEPIQGEGGINLPKPGYLADLKVLCKRHDLLLIFDEVQVGMGRTGTLFAYEQEGVTPDIMTLAKALGNGLPVGAMLASDEVAQAFAPGTHATTFGGTPLVTSVALRVLQLISQPDFLKRVRQNGGYLKQCLADLQSRHASLIKDVRGRGLIVGMELDRPGQQFVEACLKRGVIINCTHDTVLRMVPPLIVERRDIDRLVSVLDEVFQEETA
ncbi:aspartate aminotransferase family protein [Desulfoferrobacter suflitae]|uniref:aspartate aminotransferase family protein n=1 Tax=Desulfoferrobacter suflitae TaxID=2865782 RepID=UPI0021641DB0|nr:aspartate aminotransferase family protein [Desulfoferrobacter suflitae]MCK8601301.1 aspartate aminotransferase family protein [Desulfoferrobacter suflitae]